MNLVLVLSKGGDQKKNTSFYPHFVDKEGGGRPMWISERGGGSANVDSLYYFIKLLYGTFA